MFASTTILKWIEDGVYRQYTMVLSKIVVYLFHDGCMHTDSAQFAEVSEESVQFLPERRHKDQRKDLQRSLRASRCHMWA